MGMYSIPLGKVVRQWIAMLDTARLTGSNKATVLNFIRTRLIVERSRFPEDAITQSTLNALDDSLRDNDVDDTKHYLEVLREIV